MCKKNENLINNSDGTTYINLQKHNLRNGNADNNPSLIQVPNGSIGNGNLQTSHNPNNLEKSQGPSNLDENSKFQNFVESLKTENPSESPRTKVDGDSTNLSDKTVSDLSNNNSESKEQELWKIPDGESKDSEAHGNDPSVIGESDDIQLGTDHGETGITNPSMKSSEELSSTNDLNSVQIIKGNEDSNVQLADQSQSKFNISSLFNAFGLDATESLIRSGIKGIGKLSDEIIDLIPESKSIKKPTNETSVGEDPIQPKTATPSLVNTFGLDLSDSLIDSGINTIGKVADQMVKLIPDSKSKELKPEDQNKSGFSISSLVNTFLSDPSKSLIDSGINTIGKVADQIVNLIPEHPGSKVLTPIDDSEIVDDITEEDEEEEEEEEEEEGEEEEAKKSHKETNTIEISKEKQNMIQPSDAKKGGDREYQGEEELDEEINEEIGEEIDELDEELYFEEDMQADESNTLEDSSKSKIPERENQENEQTEELPDETKQGNSQDRVTQQQNQKEEIKPPTNDSSAHKLLIEDFKEDNKVKKEAENKVKTFINLIDDSNVVDTLKDLKNDIYQIFINN